MSIKIDLKIFLFGVLFFLTRQIEIYATIMFFAFLHEVGHLCAGLALGFRPKTMEITPFGFRIVFKTCMEDYKKKIKQGNELCVKKMVIYLAGPIVNLFLVVHSDQQIAAQPTQNTLLDRPNKVLTQRRKSSKEDGFQLT